MVEGFVPSSGQAVSTQPGESLAEGQRGGGGRGQLQSLVVQGNGVEWEVSKKEFTPGSQSTPGQSFNTETSLMSGENLVATEPPPRVKERETPRDGRRGTEIL